MLVQTTRFTPYVLLYAASRGGQEVVVEVMERLRLVFFDEEVWQRMRETFLQHSSA